ncbi:MULTISPECIES: metal ABC transporter substrate-binding protein [unclassified Nocardioides]|uniref:metal ABC transporter substrate-binding protein n=1 Tax=unclassified Nocardioides TaxID=2615069 RepID=UPI003611D4F3
MKSFAVAAVGAALLLPVVSGCAAFQDDSGSSADGVEVAAAFYPLQYVAERVAGDRATVANLTAPGGEPHDLELTVKETAQVAQADLVVYLDGFQPSVDEAVETVAEGAALDVSEAVELRPAGEADHDHAHEEEGEEEHDHGDTDPHFWQDPLLMADLGDAMAEQLADIDPDHADEFRDNAADLRGDLEALDAAYADGLADCERHTVVVAHDAFGYLGRYGLEFEPIAGLSPDAEPTPADLAHLQEVIADEGVTTVFYESLVSPDIAEQLANDTGAKVGVLDPIEGLTDETADEDYLSLMEQNLAALEEANGC